MNYQREYVETEDAREMARQVVCTSRTRGANRGA